MTPRANAGDHAAAFAARTDAQVRTAVRALCAQLSHEQAEYSARLAALRADGQEKSVRFKELLAKKLSNSLVISRLQAAGLWEGAASPL